MLRYLSILGFLGFPLFYLLRFTKSSAPYDDWVIRAVDAVLCLGLFFKESWPEKLKPYYFAYSYLVLMVTLPLTFAFTSLKNGGGSAAVANTLMGVFIVILLTDWRNMIAMLVAGFGLGSLLYVVVDPNPRFPVDYVQRLPTLLAVMVGGSLFKFAAERATAEKVRDGYASLAGSIAHEMRNPLSQLKHSLENMQNALPPPTTGVQRQSLDATAVDALYGHLAEGELAVKRGLQVISMTLDEVNLKPLEAAAFAYLSAAEVCAKAVQEYGYANEEERGKVSLRVIRDFTLRGDETACLFVLFNLLKNALYYVGACPTAQIIITVDRQQVQVRDSGPGIQPEVMARLFQPFASVGKSGGTGLGLAYCSRVMKAFGGQIGCESVVGQYTEFTLRFPLVSDEESQAYRLAVLDGARAAFAGKRLLIVDNDAAQRVTTRHKLQPLGAIVDQAADGQRALDALAKQRYDLVLLDLNMPVLDGYAVAERIRRDLAAVTSDVRIVAYTSEPAHLASIKTQKAGMDGFVNKPCAQLPLIQALQHALEHPPARVSPEALLMHRRFLLADDSPHNRKAVAAYLRHAGATVDEVSHGQAVLEHLTGPNRWDAILMDINMPGMNGLEAAQAVRASGMSWRDVPIIALTAHSDERTVREAASAGMNDFLTKPVEARVLYQKLSQLVSGGAVAFAPTAPIALPAETGGPLLNLERLEGYRRMGILQELLDDYLPEIASLADRLEYSVAACDLQQTLDTLHSLLGMSGEAGAQTLYQMVRRTYVPMVEARAWPAASGWAGQIAALAAQSGHALRRYGAMQAAAPAIEERIPT